MYRVTQCKVSRSQLSAQNQLSYNNWILKIEPLNTYRILKNDNPLQLDTMHYINTSTVLNNLKIFVTLQCGEEEVMVKTKYKVLYCLSDVVSCDTLQQFNLATDIHPYVTIVDKLFVILQWGEEGVKTIHNVNNEITNEVVEYHIMHQIRDEVFHR